jgi:hypothetical protein
MDVDDATLLRELRRALDSVAGQGQDAQAEALRGVLARLNATLDDVVRAVGRVKQRHARELSGLAQRLSALADQRAEDAETADAVDSWLRAFGRGGTE